MNLSETTPANPAGFPAAVNTTARKCLRAAKPNFI